MLICVFYGILGSRALVCVWWGNVGIWGVLCVCECVCMVCGGTKSVTICGMWGVRGCCSMSVRVCVWYAVYSALCPDEVRILVLPWHRLNSLSTQGSLDGNDLPRIP